ncbi:MAG: nucleoside hydrolase [Clostridia bacterium]|nr:nucleoside hydrolase [Clostridia bacterium]
MMRNILIDTDIGIDCDDAMAIAAAIALEKQEKIRILGISVCTARMGATSAVAAICNYYGKTADVGCYQGKKLACDERDVYDRALMEKYGEVDFKEESVRYLRRKLVEAEGKVTLVTIGPLTNIAALLLSKGDDISPLNGRELVFEKVDAVYSMIGNFVHINVGEPYGIPEWNVVQDIESCRIFVDKCPVEIVFSPYETGYAVLSGKTFTQADPVGYAIYRFFEENPYEFNGQYVRCSWDPITVCEAAGEGLFSLSDYGTVKVDGEGVMSFKKGKGKHRYLIQKESTEVTAEKLEKIYSQVK